MDEGTLVEQQSTLWVEVFVEYSVNLIYLLISLVIDFVEVISGHCESFFKSILLRLIDFSEILVNFYDSAFSDFQIKLLQVFFCILTVHVLAICVAWKIYSERITQRFLKPSQYEISSEQLKTAVSELKLPSEHTPRW